MYFGKTQPEVVVGLFSASLTVVNFGDTGGAELKQPKKRTKKKKEKK